MSFPARRVDRLLLVATALVLGVAVLYPALRFLLQAVPSWDPGVFERRTFATVLNTLFIALGSVATSGLVGTVLAFVMTRIAFPGRALAAALAYLPFFFNDTATTESYTLSLHDALPISVMIQH